MSATRIAQLENQVADLRVANARLAESVEHLSKAVEGLTVTVVELRAIMNRGRGAFWLVGLLGAIMFGAAGASLRTFLGK